ncbi:MAG: UDP-N-acetylmuramoylalanyl-D-glutamyl-2,6-diaminopimelate--D-alanyl-D-alanine ligase [Rhizobiaceae bacterium]
MTLLWTTDDLVAAMHARPVGALPEGIRGISIDTRTTVKGDGFFAIRGDRLDGHDFVGAAQKAGAVLAVVAEEKLVSFGHLRIPLLVVSDVLEAMRALARASRDRSHARIVAVTGSVGKTSTKEMLRTALSSSGSVHASAASFNNHWGVPLTLARMPQDTDFGVFEIGMNHAGEITPLVKMVRPHVALVTNVAAAHLGAFSSIDEIAHAKGEIFSGLEKGGVALINRSDRRHAILTTLAKQEGVGDIRYFGTSRECRYRLKRRALLAENSVVEAVIGDRRVTYTIGAPGDHLVFNSLAVLGTADAVEADVGMCAVQMARVVPEKGRGRRHVLHGIGLRAGGAVTLIDESYNANPASMDAAISVLGAAKTGTGGRRIAVLGDMLELGKTSARLHAALARPLEKAGIDLVFLVGSEMEALARTLPAGMLGGHFASVSEAGNAISKKLKGGDVVMLKASNGLKFASLAEQLVSTFQEPASAAE